MSWKSLVCAGLVCVLASPAMAQPTLSVTGGDVDGGNRVWTVSASPDPDFFVQNDAEGGLGGSLAFELGFVTTGGNILNVVHNSTNIEKMNVGNAIFGWEDRIPTSAGMHPDGIQFQGNEAFAALGSTFFQSAGPHEILTITTDESVSELAWGGIFNPNGTIGTAGTDFLTGRIAQGAGDGTNATNYDGFAGSLAAPGGGDFIPGDFDGSGGVENNDLTLLLDNWAAAVPPVPAGWVGDQPTAPGIDNDELTALLDHWGQVAGSGAGLAANSTAVPEPTSLLFAAVGLISLGLLRRRQG